MLGLEFVIAGRFGPEFAVAGWVGLELFIARPLHRYLRLEFAVAGCLVWNLVLQSRFVRNSLLQGGLV